MPRTAKKTDDAAPRVQLTTVAVPADIMPAIDAKKLEAMEQLGIKLNTSQIVQALIRKGLRV